jgi:hypothetical protein
MVRFLTRFTTEEAGGGPVTVDWLVLLSGLTVTGLTLMEVLGGAMEGQAQQVRSELQSPHFDTAWLDGAASAAAAPSSGTSGWNGGQGAWGEDQSVWDASDGTEDDAGPDEGLGSGAPPDNGRGGPHGNNGHGNDEDGNDDSNPGASNAADDHDDQDGTPGGQAKHEDGDGDGKSWREGEGTSGSPDTGVTGPVVPVANVQGCPSNAYIAEPIALTGRVLSAAGLEIEGLTIGGATTNVNQCDGIPGNRFFYANPTMTLDLSELGRFEEFTVGLEADDCKPALLVQDATGAFHFRNGRKRGGVEIELSRMDDLEGRVNIWVGTDRNRTCGDGEIEIEIDD